MTSWDRRAGTGALLVLSCAIFWGTAGVASRFIYEAGTAGFLEIAFWRLALAAPLLLLLATRLAGSLPAAAVRQHRVPLCIIGVAVAGFQIGYFGAIAAVGVTVATLIGICGIPVLVALGAAILFREHLDARAWLALALAVCGTVLLVTGAGDPALPGASGLKAGLPLALFAAVSFSVVTLAGRTLPAAVHPLWTTGLTLLVGALVLGAVLAAAGFPLPSPHPPTLAAMLWIALLPTAVAYVFFYIGVRRIPSRLAGVLILAEPLTATLLARLLHGEVLGLAGWAGALLLLAGMLTMALRRTGPDRAQSEPASENEQTGGD
jgi:drug/metabolite transporter, DME family